MGKPKQEDGFQKTLDTVVEQLQGAKEMIAADRFRGAKEVVELSAVTLNILKSMLSDYDYYVYGVSIRVSLQ
jgi:hypothetical protein